MVIDAVLMKRELTWLATEREKVAYCRQDRNVSEEALPRLIFEGGGSRTVRYFPDKLPLGVSDGSGEVALVYLVTEPTGRAFRTFLDGHSGLLKRLSRWRLLLVLPRAFTTAEAAHRAVVTDLCAAPLRPAVLDEFRWFCGVRRTLEEGVAQRVTFDAARYGRRVAPSARALLRRLSRSGCEAATPPSGSSCRLRCQTRGARFRRFGNAGTRL